MNNGIIFVVPIRSAIGGINTWFNLIEEKCISENINVFTVDKGMLSSEKFKKNLYEKYIAPIIFLKNQKRQIKKLKNDACVLHIATSGGNGYFRDYKLLKLGKKLGLYTIMHLHYGNIENDFRNKFRRKYFYKCKKYTDLFISIDSFSSRFLDENLISNKFINNPVKKNEYCFNKTSKNFVFVGQLRKEKGILELIDAFNAFNTKHNDYSLKIIGPYNQDMKKEIENRINSKITICGPLKHESTLQEIANSRCLILPSYSEGSPNVILEAMSFGIPCIGTNVGNIPNILENCGLVIKPKNSSEILNAMAKIVNDEDLVFEFSKNSYRKVNDLYSLNNVFKDLKQIWGLK